MMSICNSTCLLGRGRILQFQDVVGSLLLMQFYVILRNSCVSTRCISNEGGPASEKTPYSPGGWERGI